LNALVLKTSMRLKAYRGFESLPLRCRVRSDIERPWRGAVSELGVDT